MPDVGLTFNAVEGYGLEETMHLVDFPYVELFHDSEIVCHALNLEKKGKFVIAAYSSPDKKNFDRQLFLKRKGITNSAGGDLLHMRDDCRYLVSGYFPSAVKVDK